VLIFNLQNLDFTMKNAVRGVCHGTIFVRLYFFTMMKLLLGFSMVQNWEIGQETLR